LLWFIGYSFASLYHWAISDTEKLMIQSYSKKLIAGLIFISIFISTPGYVKEVTPFIPATPDLAADLKCLETNIYRESNGEPYAGMLAVGLVTLNRVKSSMFPSTVCKVVHQPYQFSWTMVDPRNIQVPSHIRDLALRLLTSDVEDITKGALYFHRYDVKKPPKRSMRIQNHVFY
jgi:spore germination cell wall hydrolase CwlJ-like protein